MAGVSGVEYLVYRGGCFSNLDSKSHSSPSERNLKWLLLNQDIEDAGGFMDRSNEPCERLVPFRFIAGGVFVLCLFDEFLYFDLRAPGRWIYLYVRFRQEM